MNSIIFIYHKAGVLKVLDTEQAKIMNDQLISAGWEHTQTLNPCVWIEFLFNQCDEIDILAEVKELSMRVK